MRPIVTFVAMLVALATSASAQSVPRPVCLDSATTQAAMTACAGEYHEATKRRLDQVLADARASLDTTRQGLLDASQRAWEAYAQAHCELEGSAVAGGTMYPMTVMTCLADLTEQRVREVESVSPR